MPRRRLALHGLLASGALLVGSTLGRQAGAQVPGAGAAPNPATPRPPSPADSALPLRPLRFPRDHGAHPAQRTEWWYLTGELLAGPGPGWTGDTGAGRGARRFGFQITFFRSRVDATQGMASAFAARQLLFAHAALTDVDGGRLHHDQRIARAGFGIARAAETDTDLRLRDWTLARQADGRYAAQVQGADFSLALQARPTQPLLLQGEQGLSRKGPPPEQPRGHTRHGARPSERDARDYSSCYYSQPQLEVQGSLRLEGQPLAVSGRAWLDHEWSESLLHPEAVGWDWVGMNLDDGGALTVFQLRRADGGALWAGGSWRTAGGALRTFGPGEVRMTPGRTWTSPLTGTAYPVAWTLQTPAGRFTVEAVVDAQELDSRRSTGAVYWEGLSALRQAGGPEEGREVGRGYLELTGYGQRLAL